MENAIKKPIFADRKLNQAKLTAYGFKQFGGAWEYQQALVIQEAGQFWLTVRIDDTGQVQTRLVDADGGEYVLHRNPGVAGAFVGAVRAAHDEALEQIAASCFDQAVFKEPQTLALIDYVAAAYGDELEFLWAKLPQAAIWRRNPSRKWYGVIMTIGRDKLGESSSELVEIADLHCRAEDMAGRLAAGARPGYHMNKKYWFTVTLDGTLDFELLTRWLAQSWELAGGKSGRK